MSLRFLIVRARSVVAVLLAMVIGCAAPLRAIAHDRTLFESAAAESHQILGDPLVTGHEHGHTHDEAEPGEQRPGHDHGHNPSDHTHDPGHVAAMPPSLSPSPNAGEPLGLMDHREKNLPERLDRPPRPLS